MIRKEAVLIGIIAWVIVTLLYSDFGGGPNGRVLVGFPWHFYASYPDTTLAIFEKENGFNFVNFILDITALAAFIYLVNTFLSRNVKKMETK